ncbi:efflux RND transporter periplasmic adaptor subunit [Allochromatium vinosum]|uniref:Efflux transporter, RND family, MFP subunit n=1 Tax=Allochromatium vinosum (strain ATCC 17899 / DSM 180 / NBRC 103801 / NCIMB 10441 / D) TaxID=572477 RepID=D3RRT7_ALLVD|nr:efflux RND transporter periplasmic adaptor subunit [Allochromatium vinosum]ADC61991.1 efflux transporter, RND family, MFP subunit [Allochromatium vinosum DSM 180]
MNVKGLLIRRRAIQILGALALLALLAWGFRPVPRLVDVEPVTRGPLAVTLVAEGRTRVVERYRISAPVDGQLRRLELEVGDPVRAGQVIAVLDAQVSPVLDRRSQERARARLASAESDLAATRAAVTAADASANLARMELERIERLAGQGMVSRTQLDQARAESLGRDAELEAARFRVQSAERDRLAALAELEHAGESASGEQGRLELRAPVAGVVLKRESESARVVHAGDPILELGDPGALEIEVDVLSADAVRLAVGMRVRIERWGESNPLEARIKRIEPVAFTKISALGVEEQRVWVIAERLAPQADWSRLGDGYRVNARFVLWEAEDVLQAPTSSLFRHGEGWALFRAVDGRARLTPVEIGRRGALQTELRRGVEVGASVIVHPDRELADGARITPRQ